MDNEGEGGGLGTPTGKPACVRASDWIWTEIETKRKITDGDVVMREFVETLTVDRADLQVFRTENE